MLQQNDLFSDTVESLQAELADCRAQLEHWQGVATICELSKQEELGELQRQCDQEIQSLQEALRGICLREFYCGQQKMSPQKVSTIETCSCY